MLIRKAFWALRSIFFFVYFFITAVISLPFLATALLLKKGWRFGDWYVQGWVKTLVWVAGIHIKVKGAPIQKAPTVYVGNHLSFFDVVICIVTMPRPMAFISKIENKKMPLVSWWMYALGCVFIDRSDLRQQVKELKKAQDRLTQGLSYTLFPEGTRSKDGSLQEFKPGAFKVATKAGVDIQPFGIDGTSGIMKSGSIIVYPVTVTMNFGEVIRWNETMNDHTVELASDVKERVRTLVKEISGNDPAKANVGIKSQDGSGKLANEEMLSKSRSESSDLNVAPEKRADGIESEADSDHRDDGANEKNLVA